MPLILWIAGGIAGFVVLVLAGLWACEILDG